MMKRIFSQYVITTYANDIIVTVWLKLILKIIIYCITSSVAKNGQSHLKLLYYLAVLLFNYYWLSFQQDTRFLPCVCYCLGSYLASCDSNKFDSFTNIGLRNSRKRLVFEQ